MITRTLIRRRSRALVSVLLLGAACSTDKILKVETPDIIGQDKLNGVLGANTYYAGALGDFAVAHDGGNGATGSFGTVASVGLFTDEMQFGGTPPEVRQLDLRAVTKENSFFRDIFYVMHRARQSAERAAQALIDAKITDGRAGEMYAVAGLATTILGEAFCSGIPFSSTLTGTPEYGSPLSTSEVMDKALGYLALASANVGSNQRAANLTKVVKGRALLSQKKYADAAAAVAGVPTDFVYQNQHSDADARTQNQMKGLMYDFDYTPVSVGPDGTTGGEVGYGLPFAAANDPRVVTDFTGVSRFDGKTPMYRLPLYESFSSPVVAASGVEARLIEAEAALNANDLTSFLGKLTAARIPFGMGPVADPGTALGRKLLLFSERAFALYATAHRVGDQRRMVRDYGLTPVQAGVPPAGTPYHKDNLLIGNGGPTDQSFVIPANEENNPNYKSEVCKKDTP